VNEKADIVRRGSDEEGTGFGLHPDSKVKSLAKINKGTTYKTRGSFSSFFLLSWHEIEGKHGPRPSRCGKGARKNGISLTEL